ncbi:hypothetical protein DFQ28_006971 [Apophysomyces sp. BC1034]|nr:hypothetical protein DFQ30_006994 [Apophysomyces sp. BC1015]KAG0176574.1 hypothetical protein DFQ29_005958 [Apophysomyces sp. BC1021]KAG0187016.1 hypothetical protein DFQ28_006971 [Apophysomyces sp. BC1034]
MNHSVASKVLIAVAASEWKSDDPYLAQGLPDYADMCRRRLGGQWMSVGDCFRWTIGGKSVVVTVQSIYGDGDGTRFKVDRKQTDVQVALERPIKVEHKDELVQTLANTIRSSYETHAFRVLGIPVAKSILVHGVSGVGKATLVRRVSQVLQSVTFSISIHELLAFKEEYENPKWINYNPLHLLMNKAISAVPSIVTICDLDALQSDTEKNTKITDILAYEINRIADSEQVR